MPEIDTIAPDHLVTLARPPGLARRPAQLEFRCYGTAAAPITTPELVAACLLIPSMAKGVRLELPGRLDRQLGGSLPELQARLASWNRPLREVEVVEAEPREASDRAGKADDVGLCFTGGVDSFYSLVSRRDEVDALVYVLGFDLEQKKTSLWSEVHAMLSAVAAHYGKRLIVVETKLRQMFDEALPWGMTHGTALAAVGHLLGGDLGKLIVPSSFSRGQLHPWGSHPELDPLWSSGRVEIEHDTTEITRLEKLRRLVDEGFPLEHLRVCWENPDGAYNCGSCAKCFRTKAALRALGALGRATTTFPGEIDYAAAARMDLGDETDGLFLEEIRISLSETGRDPELQSFFERLPLAQAGPRPVPFSVLRHENALAGLPLRVRRARVEVDDGRTSLTAPVEWGELRTELKIESDLGGANPENIGDALLMWFVMAAMFHRVPLELEDTVSEELLETIEEAQRCWAIHPSFPYLDKVEIQAPSAPCPGRDESLPWGSAFSAGVDATFTAVSERERLGYLVWLDGIDSERIDQEVRACHHARIRDAAETIGRRLVTVRTNLRRVLFRDLGLHWGAMYVMAPYGAGHFLSPHISRMLIGSEVSYVETTVAPSARAYDPVLDQLVSSPRLRIKVHGMTHRRHEKIAALAERPGAFDHLMVCAQWAISGFHGPANCGRCEKCLRTLAAIRMAGAPHPSAAFASELDLEALQAVSREIKPLHYHFHVSLLEEVERRGDDPELAEALRKIVVDGGKRLGRIADAESTVDLWSAAPDWAEQLQANAATVAAAVMADKPSARLRSLVESELGATDAQRLAAALVTNVGRRRIWRQVLKRMFGKGGQR